tara:strand:+ start:32 stop:832 length:801 start_codon:yes stop_codon:yes gene_type:complete
MEFLKLVRKRSFLSELLYAVLNVGLAVAVLMSVWFTDSISLAIILVLLSKWRIFAVRPRYWWANLRSNMVDIILSLSVVLHLYGIATSDIATGAQLLAMSGLTLLYIGWLLFVKPRSKKVFVIAQAGLALFMGTSALFTFAYDWPVSLVVVFMWLIAYSSARHMLSAYDDETHALFLSLVWGVVAAEISWVAYHWAIAYPLPVLTGLMVPQVAIIMTLISFVGYKAYDSFYKHAKIRANDILLPLLFTLSVLVVLLVLFNRVGTAI